MEIRAFSKRVVFVVKDCVRFLFVYGSTAVLFAGAGLCFLCIYATVYNPVFFNTVPWLFFAIFLAGGGLAAVVFYLAFFLLGTVFKYRPLVFLESLTLKKFMGLWLMAGGILLCLSVYAHLAQNNRPGDYAPNLLVLGLDGATWDVMDAMMESQGLPGMQKLRSAGVSGVLQSLEPMRSPSLWTSIATGVRPETHGVEGFFSTQDDLLVPRVWDIFERQGRRVGLFSWLVTWPPQEEHAFVVPSWFAPSPEAYPAAYTAWQEIYLEQDRGGGPLHLYRSLKACVKLGLTLRSCEEILWFYFLDWLGMSEEERLARKSFMEVSAKTDLFLAMLTAHQPHVAAFCLYGTDKLAHRFWHYMEPEKFDGVDEEAIRKYNAVLPNYYKSADAAFARILSTLTEDTYVILVSDHGMKADEAIPRQFFLDIPAFLDRLAVADDVHYQKVMRHVLLEPIRAPIGFTRRLMEQIEQIHFEGDEDALFSVEEDEKGRISIRTNFSLTWNEDSPLLRNEHILIDGQRVPVDDLFFVRTFSGAHDLNGIFCLSGPGVKKSVKIQGASLLDIAPTMLYMLGVPVWRGMDGQVLTEAFEEAYIERYPIDYIEAIEPLEQKSGEKADDNRALMERLRSLGYIR